MNLSMNTYRVVLVALGSVSAFVAINMALGGLETLGWQGPTDYFQITDPDGFDIRDSHARFYGGVYSGIAAALIVSATDVAKYRQTLSLVFTLIFVGGLARISQGDFGVMFGSDLLVSSVVELVGMPLLLLWTYSLTTDPRQSEKVLAR